MNKQIMTILVTTAFLTACNGQKNTETASAETLVDTMQIQKEVNIATHDAAYEAMAKQLLGTWTCENPDDAANPIKLEFLADGVLKVENLPGDTYTNWELSADNLNRVVLTGLQEVHQVTFTVTEMLELRDGELHFMGRPLVLKK